MRSRHIAPIKTTVPFDSLLQTTAKWLQWECEQNRNITRKITLQESKRHIWHG